MSQTATITRPATALSVGGKSNSPSSPMAAEGIELQCMGTGQSVGKDITRVGQRRRTREGLLQKRSETPMVQARRQDMLPMVKSSDGTTLAATCPSWLSPFCPSSLPASTTRPLALIPYLEQYYDLNYTIVSLVFLTPFAGYSVAAFTNARIHMKYGQRGVAVMAPLCHIVTYAVVATHPPFPVIVVIYAISGFGNGLTDACYCAWVGDMDKANQVQGFMHACYSLGALFAPLIATSMVVKAGLPWYTFYYIMIARRRLRR
ncbi:hypothetical protein BN1723_003744 [Verticillium longisporum]|uniref:Major facilitator superfamily (MFS) profile domain-containing protein n=1 Tax=Verticillium longisporum TaxID=100787 RepID=A0A0G4MA55_VERLO|nr:hypothetical protein BN1723_003744 [Verticillium longisporum]